jgi:hypothetical protein
MAETFPLDDIADAYEKVANGVVAAQHQIIAKEKVLYEAVCFN